jgi:hypothetical protein
MRTAVHITWHGAHPCKLWRYTSIFNLCCHLFREIIEDIDEDGSGLLEFGEFCQLAAKFLVEEDEEALKKELKEAFRIYDKVNEALECRRLFLTLWIWEYWRIYIVPSFIAVEWLGSSPTPSPLSRQQVVSLSQSSCVSPVELTDGRVWEGAGEEPNHTRTRKPGPL